MTTADRQTQAPAGTVLTVSEVFGPTHQGEGASAGRLAVFLRVAGCNLRCTWCDTKYTWNWRRSGTEDLPNRFGPTFDPKEEMHSRTIDQVISDIQECMGEAKLLVISGGEPMLQERALARVAHWWFKLGSGHCVEIETNGTVVPKDLFPPTARLRFNVSPKLDSSGQWNVKHLSIGKDVLSYYIVHSSSIFKFVVQDDHDLQQVVQVVQDCDIPKSRVWVMPEGTTAEAISDRLSWLAPEAVRLGFNITTRVHVLAYGSKRGV